MDIVDVKVTLKPENCINQLDGKLKLGKEVLELARIIAKNVQEKMLLEGKNPFTIAGASVLIASNLLVKTSEEKLTADLVAQAA